MEEVALMRTVIVVYSRSGRSLRIAEMLAARTNARLCRIDCPRYRGFRGWLRGWRDARRGYLPEIDVVPEIGAADLLILGGPVWAGRFAPPLRSLMDKANRLPPVVGVFATRNRINSTLPLEADLMALAAAGPTPDEPLPLLSLARRTLRGAAGTKAVERFAERLAPLVSRRKLPALLPLQAA
ncbi:hypothetical protein HKCCSP123_03315 [Rhodobacterales bacterium HKCCSP123]|nr:hypothetical protein [Rhodobacterales bacterium HKCCSP123]